jgi:Bacterial capsule synthesis protein PGA_cap
VSGRLPSVALAGLALGAPAAATAQEPPALELRAPRVVGTGTAFELRGAGARPGSRVQIELALRSRWGASERPSRTLASRGFAAEALRAGATAVIGAHPHVLQPIRSGWRRRLVAYSLGTFVFGAGSPGTASTGIFQLKLSTRGVEGSHFRCAVIEATRPRLL